MLVEDMPKLSAHYGGGRVGLLKSGVANSGYNTEISWVICLFCRDAL